MLNVPHKPRPSKVFDLYEGLASTLPNSCHNLGTGNLSGCQKRLDGLGGVVVINNMMLHDFATFFRPYDQFYKQTFTIQGPICYTRTLDRL